MATRLLERKTGMEDTAQTLQALPWIPTGVLIDSAVIKAVPGLVGAIYVRKSGNSTTVKLWDSPTTDTTGDVEIARVFVPDNGKDYLLFPLPGIEAKLGIYVEIEAGKDPEVIVYYK